MIKRILALALMCCVLCAGTTQAFAAESGNAIYEPQMSRSARMSYIARASCDLYIDSAGTATVKSSVNGYQGTTTKISISASLQQYKNGKWTSLKSYPASKDSHICSLTETYKISKGYAYRVQSTITAYSGSASETRTVTSSEAKY